MESKRNFLAALSFAMFIVPLYAQYQYPFQNPNLPTEVRINNILSLMTLDEKIACLSTDPSVQRLGIKGTRHVEGLHGLAMGGPSNWGSRNPMPTTIFPQAYGMAETWDTSLMRLIGQIEGYDIRYAFQSKKYHRGGLVVRAPNADIGRDPRWGRTEECYGEDAWFNGTMAVAFIRGLQGDHPKYWQTASLMKHFLANSNENGRDSTSSNFDERLLHEYYSLSFRKGVVEGGSNAYMAAYNSYNGIPCTVNPILRDITMKQWGLNGIICTDGGAFSLLVNKHRFYPDLSQAAAGCIKAGITQFLDRTFSEGVNGALLHKYITEADIDSVIKGNFRVMIKLGMLDPQDNVPYSSIGVKDTIDPWTTEKNKAAVRLVTQKSIVLLKNVLNTLPLDKNKIKKIAVIGPRAGKVLLDWYSGTPPYTVSPLEGIKKKVGIGVDVSYARNNNNDSAVNIARTADVVIVCVGNHTTCDADWAECPTPSEGKEAIDRQTIILEQEDLIKQVYKVNTNTIVVLISNFPYAINWSQENVPAIVHFTHCSMELGNALADVLFGDFNPGGRLVQTWPKSIDQLPPMMDYNIRNGRTYMYFKGEPLYPFGYGLSYTTFKYSGLRTNSNKLKANGDIRVSVTLQNTGKRPGDEVVQLYIKHLNSKVERPVKELKGFSRVFLNAGETKSIEITLKASDLAYWDQTTGNFMVEADKVKLMVGASSSDIRMEKNIDVVK
jgi:beta-glucosidase